jgi:3-oxoacyl-[acyl-carrier protein] reductase
LDNNSLAGKTALVTGAVGGIGSAVCRDLAAAGITIIPIDIDAAALEALCQKLPIRCYPLVVDVSDSSAVSEACQRAFNELAPADILVNCAGILSNNKLAATEVDEWRRVMAINVDGSLHTTQQVIPHMQAQRWGRIVNLASWAWKSGGLTAGTAYTTSKGAVVSLTFSVAREFAEHGITANAIAPCYVMSRMVSEQLTEQQRTDLLAQLPVHRFCQPEEIAHAVRFFISPLAGFITGEVLDMNGGLQFD